MIATITYNLPEEKMEHLRAVKSSDIALALWEISDLWTKHKLPKSTQAYNERIREILDEYNININELVE
jgi:hypothetical protein